MIAVTVSQHLTIFYVCITANTLRAVSIDIDAIAAASRKEQPWCSAVITCWDEGWARKFCFKSVFRRSLTRRLPPVIWLSAKSTARNSSCFPAKISCSTGDSTLACIWRRSRSTA